MSLSTAAFAAHGPAEVETEPPSSPGSLVVPDMQPLLEGQGVQAQEEAHRSSPEAVAERRASETKFENLNASQAATVASEAFPGVIDRPAGGPPPLPAGQKIVSYPRDNVAKVDLGGGKRAAIESIAPMAIETSRNQRKPIDLDLDEAGNAFKPASPVANVSIPKQLGEGVQLSESNISVTPVTAEGAALEGSEGSVDGASVLYANTQTDTDTIAKPTISGFEIGAMLRSANSPSQLYYRIGMPSGASLVQQTSSGPVQILDGGTIIATVLAPGAHDAAGTPVPVSMEAKGDLLSLTIEDRSGEY
jgi:hypothetical protein